ncbi:MAG: putative manganese-dependent inorganic diphosphatase [Sphaerochaeta sp.]
MAEIYVCGHRNPDMDSICAAYSYAYLKSKVDPNNTYLAVRCGNLNDTTKAQFERLRVTPPPFIKDVRTKVLSVTRNTDSVVQITDPVYTLVSFYGSSNRSSVVPVMEGAQYRGLLSVDEVSSFVLKENSGQRPLYHFVVENFPKVLKGSFLKRGSANTFDAPIMVGAMRYVIFCRHMESLEGRPPILVVGDREDHIRKAIELQIPAIILTGIEDNVTSNVDWDAYQGTVYLSALDTAETLRLLRLSVPVKELMVQDPIKIEDDCLFDVARDILADSEYRGLPVFSGGEYKGFVTRRCFLDRPKTKVIMVDHNESEQGVSGIEEAEVLEIIDHHRLGAAKTRNPIYICCEPLGSTCTIIYKLFLRHNVEITQEMARVLLSGIVSDTVMLKSPTTTFEDYTAVQDLLVLGDVSDMRRFGETMFSSGASLAKEEPKKMISSDFKVYRELGVAFGIGQCEVTTLSDVDEYKDAYLFTLDQYRLAQGLDWAMFLITDVVRENSMLLMTSLPITERKLAYEKAGEGIYFLPGVLSRKKQLLPEILRVLEE